jgi:hypothetical protein
MDCRIIGKRKGKDVAWYLSRPGYPKLLSDPAVSKDSSLFWSSWHFEAFGKVITNTSYNIRDAHKSFTDAISQIANAFEAWTKECVYCDYQSGKPAGWEFPLEKTWMPNDSWEDDMGVRGVPHSGPAS